MYQIDQMDYLNAENVKVIKQNTMNVKQEVLMNLLLNSVIVITAEIDGDSVNLFLRKKDLSKK